MPDAFITATSSVLPGPAVGNDAIEQVLGRVGNDPSRLKSRILKNNGIQQRHYAIDHATGLPTHTTAGLAAEAVRAAVSARGLGLDDIDLLACATSIPEHLMPGHASMVHGELGAAPCEIASLHGVCSAGISALKYATLAVKAGGARNAVVSGAERTSMVLRSGAFRAELAARTLAEEEDPYLGFNQEFLRWMLSDGAGACVVQDRPREAGLSLKVEFVELVSFANELPVCMYMGGEPTPTGGLHGWRDGESMEAGIAAVRAGVTAADIARAENDVFRRHGLGEYCTSKYTRVRGHGLGLMPDMKPAILEDVDTVLEAGMTIIVHPNTYHPEAGYMVLGDVVVVGETGCEVLTRTPRRLFEV